MLHLKGKTIHLRDWQLADLAVFQQWNTGKHEWMNYDGPYYPKMTAEQLENRVKEKQEKIEEYKGNPADMRRGLVIVDAQTNQCLGTVTWYWESKETWWLSNGIVIYDPNHWGRGIGFEALGLWNQHLFDAIPEIARLDLRTWSGNDGMMRLAEKLGYSLEARFRKARIVNGTYYDSIGYGVLREEWDGKYPNGFGAILR
ncbi:MAG: GNAT family N-acetyltransferase [Chitinophagales bacterium]